MESNLPDLEYNMHIDILRMKSTMQYIEEDIELMMQKVTYANYNSPIPNLFEKLTDLKSELLSIRQRSDLLMKQLNVFENKISFLQEFEDTETDIIPNGQLQSIREKMNLLKYDYKLLKGKIVNFTVGLLKN